MVRLGKKELAVEAVEEVEGVAEAEVEELVVVEKAEYILLLLAHLIP